jgi:hypothetical protein
MTWLEAYVLLVVLADLVLIGLLEYIVWKIRKQRRRIK